MVNHLVFHGRMVADPELNETLGGTKVVNFRTAWNEKYKERETKCFLECKAFGTLAEFIGSHFRKGQELIVEGKLTTEEWEKDGQKRSKIVLSVSSAHFCGSKKDGGNDQGVPVNMTPVETDELPF